jgi:hypothetical protein
VSARDVWQRQFEQVTVALKPFERVTSDGFHYVDPTAPTKLRDYYRSLCSTGYLYGWLTSARWTVERRLGGRWVPVTRSDPHQGDATWRTREAAEHARDVFASDLGWHVRVGMVVDGMVPDPVPDPPVPATQ